jgi:hypothetical protein
VEGGYAKIWKKDQGLPLNDENSKYTKPVMANLKRCWEEVPDRREMFTDDMLEEFYKRKTAAQPDSLEDCFYDWLGVGRYTGFRRNEWAQERKHSLHSFKIPEKFRSKFRFQAGAGIIF